MNPAQVIDMQSDLYRRLHDPKFKAIILNTLDAASEPLARKEDREALRIGLGSALERSVSLALAYRVTDDMSLLVQHAASKLDETDVFSPDLAPSEAGIVFFERPLPIRDVRGRILLMHWLVWGKIRVEISGRHHVGVAGYWFNDHQLAPDVIAKELLDKYGDSMWRDGGRWGFIGADIFRSGDPVGGEFEDVPDAQRAIILAQGDEPVPFTNTMRYVHALWMLLGQTVTTTQDEWVRKTAFKRAQQLGLPGRVTVIRLRRSEGNRHEGESLINWSHRWLVRGHPRWQQYGPQVSDHDHVLGPVMVVNGHSTKYCQVSGCEHYVARIWIAPYVKGPDGKPLKFTEHVYDLAR